MLPILALLGSAALQPLWLAFARNGNHPITVNFWALCLAALYFLPLFFFQQLPSRIFEHWWLVLLLSLFQASYALTALVFTKNHHFQIAYPLSRLGPVLILVGEIIILHQSFTRVQITGILLSSLGAMIFGFDRRLAGLRVKFFMLLTLVLVFLSVSMLLAKYALDFFSPGELWALSIFQIPISLAVILYIGETASLKRDVKRIKLILITFAGMTLSWYLALYAMLFLPAAIVSAVRSTSVLFGVFLGGRLFREGHSIRNYAAALLIIAGILFCLTG